MPLLPTAATQPGDLTAERTPNSWLPATVRQGAGEMLVEWLDFGNDEIRQPFFHLAVRKLRRSAGPEGVRLTPASLLLAVEEEVHLSGIIFNISRCGSTLLANLLRAAPAAVVISEPQPVSVLVDAPSLLRGAVRAYGRRRTGRERLLFLKLSSGNMLVMETFRRLWPGVPFLVLIRDPVEVMVSCLAGPPGWMRMQAQPQRAAQRYGWPQGEIETMPAEEFCARALGAMLTAAEPILGDRCRVIDYTQIDRQHLPAIAGFLGVGMDEFDAAELDHALAGYSKERRGHRPFSADSEAKQAAATPEVRVAAERWAMPLYQRLRAEAQW